METIFQTQLIHFRYASKQSLCEFENSHNPLYIHTAQSFKPRVNYTKLLHTLRRANLQLIASRITRL